MTSVFVDPQRGFAPLKVTFSSQEWCGHVFEETRFDTGDGEQKQPTQVQVRSYFEGETQSWNVPPAAESEDALWIRLRSPGSATLNTE